VLFLRTKTKKPAVAAPTATIAAIPKTSRFRGDAEPEESGCWLGWLPKGEAVADGVGIGVWVGDIGEAVSFGVGACVGLGVCVG
jgi:hypothetical protein